MITSPGRIEPPLAQSRADLRPQRRCCDRQGGHSGQPGCAVDPAVGLPGGRGRPVWAVTWAAWQHLRAGHPEQTLPGAGAGWLPAPPAAEMQARLWGSLSLRQRKNKQARSLASRSRVPLGSGERRGLQQGQACPETHPRPRGGGDENRAHHGSGPAAVCRYLHKEGSQSGQGKPQSQASLGSRRQGAGAGGRPDRRPAHHARRRVRPFE